MDAEVNQTIPIERRIFFISKRTPIRMSIDSKQEPVTGIDTNKNLIPTDVYANNLAHTLSHTVDMDTAHIHYVQESMSNADIITFWRKNNIAIIESDDLSDLSSAIKENLFR
ncbi:MAG: hypothetical protein H6766_03750 [Candidatus Peribacteria bacterium]|nr:MAG: hypothetical protein H6766_03750 [Candidatus Peribacteria bacterium]